MDTKYHPTCPKHTILREVSADEPAAKYSIRKHWFFTSTSLLYGYDTLYTHTSPVMFSLQRFPPPRISMGYVQFGNEEPQRVEESNNSANGCRRPLRKAGGMSLSRRKFV